MSKEKNSPQDDSRNKEAPSLNDIEETNKSLDFLREMIAHRPGGENRPQQELALNTIHNSIQNKNHTLVQAGTGTGKSFAALIPAIISGKRVVYTTATKQLSEQIIDTDIPTLKKEFKRQGLGGFSATLLKGRENYVCLRKTASLAGDDDEKETNDNGLFSEDEISIEETVVDAGIVDNSFETSGDKNNPSSSEIAREWEKLHKWLPRTTTGDRSDAPAVSDKVWKGVSVTNTECVGRKSCPFAEECFSESARGEAQASKVVVTNHAITALDLETERGSLLGQRDVFIFDEIHELDSFISNAWGTTITEKVIHDALQNVKRSQTNFDSGGKAEFERIVKNLDVSINDLSNILSTLEDGLIYPNPVPENLSSTLRMIYAEFSSIVMLSKSIKDEAKGEIVKRTATSIVDSISRIIQGGEENVVWIKNELNKKNKFKSKKTPPPPSIHCAPIRIGPKLMERLAGRDATMVGTSATITVRGGFDHPIHNFGFDGQEKVPYNAIDAGTPFDYSKQAMLYIPNPNTYPSADYANIKEHESAVEDTALNLVKAMGGRALILTTTTRRIEAIGKHLKARLPKGIKVLQQGDMPAPKIIEEFVNNETSVLVATMGMWHGLNAEGATCMLVLMDKIPFPTIDDPLMQARQQYVQKNGGNGFMEVYVATANIKIAQGFGRLIRTMKDRGVVGILDTRLATKQYGSEMLKSFPSGVRRFIDEDIVEGASNRLRIAREEELAKKEEKEAPPF